MYCSGCGQAIAPGQGFCPQCGRPAAAPVPPVLGLEFQLATYANKIRTLSIVWFIYAGLALVAGIMAMAFAHAFMDGRFGFWMHEPWAHGPVVPWIFGPALLRFAWLTVVARTCLALAAGWGLMERAPWGRVVAIIAAILNLLKFPIGTALGIGTLVVLLGYRNTTLYDRLQ
jgi:hypothetical protein